MIEHEFNRDLLYNRVVHYYIDKKKYSKSKANQIAQAVVNRELQRRTCKNESCHHSLDDHIRNAEVCLVINCTCSKFVK